MKQYKSLLPLCLVAATVALGSCSDDFLTEDSMTAITEEKVFSNVEFAEINLKSIYNEWRSENFTDDHFWKTSVGTDEIQSGALQALKSGAERAALDVYDANMNSENGYTRSAWTNRWPRVAAATKIIAALDDNDVTVGSKKAHVLGEACFLRGTLYYELAMHYGRLPIIDNKRSAELGLGRQSLKDTWTFMIEDLNRAAKYCPNSNEPGRATLYAANMMLAKAYMSAPEETGLRDFAAADKALDNVLAGPFQLVAYEDLFDYTKPNTAESIYEFQFSTSWPDNNKIQFQIGSRATQSFFGDKCYYSGYDHAVPTKYAYLMKADGGVWEEGDVRREASIRYDFTYYGVTPDLSNIQWEDLGDDYDELNPHIKKYEDFRTDEHSGLGINNIWNSGKNIPWLRLADAILMKGECQNELGNTAAACEYVNKVRARAWENNLPAEMKWGGLSKEQFREQILDERMRELFGERWRRYDLQRTRTLVKLVKERNEWQRRNPNIDDHNYVWPIPLTEIEQNPDMTIEDQNEGYK